MISLGVERRKSWRERGDRIGTDVLGMDNYDIPLTSL
jgi:hypothetical protein